MCFRSPRAAQARPQPPARPATPSNGARVQVKPRAGGRLPIKPKSRHRGVVVRDLKGRERAVRGGAEPPPGLKKCSRARQGERHCLLITGYRGVDGTFVNGHRRLYRTHPGQTDEGVPLHVCTTCTCHRFQHYCLESAPSLAVSTFPKGFNAIASSRRPPSKRRLVNTCTDLIQHPWPTSSADSSGGVVSATGGNR